MRRKKELKLTLHQKIHHHLVKHFHRHIHKVLHFVNHAHHHAFHALELIVICGATLSSLSMANLTGLNQELYTNTTSETAEHLLAAMQNPTASLKQGNIISIRSMDMDVENSFAKGYCTYGAARVSPEFFPFINDKTQQRTWGGNAVNRCKNASDTGYKIGLTPSQGALIIYNAGGRFGSYGHVGKVLHYSKAFNKIIVRDMARVGRGQMSDRREDLTTANVECYIYNSKINDPEPEIPTPTITPTTPTLTGSTPVIVTPVVTGTHNIIITNPVITNPVITNPVIPTPTITPTTPTVISQNSIAKKLSLVLEDLSDIAEHFMTQNNLEITLVAKSPLKLGEVATLTLKIQDKNTDEPFSGLLPFSFTILSTNDALQANISNIQLVNNGSVDISILGQKAGSATIVISMDSTKIGEFDVEVE